MITLSLCGSEPVVLPSTASHVFDVWFCSAQSAFGGKSFIHWTTDEESEEFFKFDVVDRNAYNEAGNFENVEKSGGAVSLICVAGS